MANPTTSDAHTRGTSSLPRIIQYSPFLRLPGLIRNIIYALVLTAPRRAIHHATDRYIEYRTKSDVKPQAHANSEHNWELSTQEPILSHELKGVCRELYKETKSLRLKFNPNVTFSSHCKDAISATERFLSFFAAVPTEQRVLVHKVELCSGVEFRIKPSLIADDKQMLLDLADVCLQNPHINVKYRLTFWTREATSSARRHVSNGTVMNAWLRHNYLDHTLRMFSTSQNFATRMREFHRDKINVRFSDREVTRLAAQNLRLFPMVGVFCDADDVYFKDTGVWLNRDGQDLMPIFLRLGNEWISEGL